MESPNRHSSPIAEIDVLWITAGLSCDGDTIAMTAATQPSIEDILRGGSRDGENGAGCEPDVEQAEALLLELAVRSR